MKTLFMSAGALALGAILSACTQSEDADNNAETGQQSEDGALDGQYADAADALGKIASTAADLAADDSAPPTDGTERFYGKRAFTIVSEQTGAESGAITEHVRAWGRLRAEIKNTTISMAGFTQATKQRVIYDGPQIVTVDLSTGAVTTTTNSFYDAIVARMKGKSGIEFGKEMMAQMGGQPTGEKGEFAGHGCDYWELASLGTRTCVTPWGGTLYTATNMAGFSMEKTATQVRMDDGGPGDAFDYDASRVQETPNLEDIMKQMRRDD